MTNITLFEIRENIKSVVFFVLIKELLERNSKIFNKMLNKKKKVE